MAKEQKGLFPEQPGGGVQGLFEQSRRAATLVEPTAAPRPASQVPPPNLPGSTPPPTKAKKPKKRRSAWRFAPHLVIALVALIGIARKNSDTKIDIPKVSQLPSIGRGSSSASTDVPAYKTMSIVPSGERIHNGVYRTSGGAIEGAATRTTFEFAVNGRGSRQRIVYYAGFHVRDRSCDHKSRNDSVAGLVLYDDELVRKSAADLAAVPKDGDERLTLRYRDASTLTGTFRFGGYTGCPTGGHFTFTATRAAANNPVVAPAVWAIGG